MSLIEKEASRARMLFVGGMTPGRERMIGGLRAAGVEALHLESAASARPRLEWCDFVLQAVAGRAGAGALRGIGAAGRPAAAVLRPEDKGLAPLSIEAGARAVFVDEVQPEEVLQFARVLGEEGLRRRELGWLRAEAREGSGGWRLEGESAAAGRLRRAIRAAGAKYRAILLEGEKGLNFRLVARALHARHPGARHPFLRWGPGMRRASLLDRGIRRVAERRGEEGDVMRRGGTLFVESVQLIDAARQKALAEALEGGGVSEGFRLILARERDPERLIQDKVIKRLHRGEAACAVEIPPLRERRKDIALVAQGVLDEFAERVGRPRRRIAPAALAWFSRQKWWGNEAELEMAVCRAFLTSEGRSISLGDLRPAPRKRASGDMEDFFRERLSSVVAALGEGGGGGFYEHAIRSVEKPLLELALREAGGSQTRAARLLGMNRNTLRRKLREFGLLKPPAARRR